MNFVDPPVEGKKSIADRRQSSAVAGKKESGTHASTGKKESSTHASTGKKESGTHASTGKKDSVTGDSGGKKDGTSVSALNRKESAAATSRKESATGKRESTANVAAKRESISVPKKEVVLVSKRDSLVKKETGMQQKLDQRQSIGRGTSANRKSLISKDVISSPLAGANTLDAKPPESRKTPSQLEMEKKLDTFAEQYQQEKLSIEPGFAIFSSLCYAHCLSLHVRFFVIYFFCGHIYLYI